MNEIVKARVIDGLRLSFGQAEADKLWEAISPEGNMVESIARALFVKSVRMDGDWNDGDYSDDVLVTRCFDFAERFVQRVKERREKK